MVQIGNKIRKIRVMKNITPKDMADKLNMSLQGYGKIERNDVSLNIDRLAQISEIFEMKPEEILSFDEKIVFSNNTLSENASAFNYGTIHNSTPEKLIKLFEEKIEHLEEKIKYLENKK